jgi:hypothetical protein
VCENMSEQVEVQENISPEGTFFEYLRDRLSIARDLTIYERDDLLSQIAHIDGDEYLKVQTAFIVGKMYAVLTQLVDVIPLAFDDKKVNDNSYRDYIINAIEALAKAYVDLKSNKYIGDVRNYLQEVFEDLDDMLTKAIMILARA